MNRRHRRAAAARARKAPATGYRGRLLAALASGRLPIEPGEVAHVTVVHDDACRVEDGRCTCVPEIIRRAGPSLATIDASGTVTEHVAQ